MLRMVPTARYKKDVRLAAKRGYDIRLLNEVVNKLINEEPLPEKYQDHPLSGNYAGFRDCHIAPDWVLVYKADKENLILLLARTGTHSDLFG